MSRPKIFMSVDMEGISSIVHQNQTGADRTDYERGRALMAGDVNAAIEGILSTAEADIVVCDGHGGMRNLESAELHEGVTLVRGSPKPLTQIEGIDGSYDAAIFIGYHSKRGTKQSILDHTISSRTIDSITINGLEAGETAINAAVAGYYGVPVVFISGDLAVTKEAKAIIPGITAVAVKEAVARTAAKCVDPKKARELIKKGVAEALEKRKSVEPFIFKPPIEVRVKYVDSLMADAVEFMPFVERIDGRTVGFVLDDYLKAFRAVWASIFIANAVSG